MPTKRRADQAGPLEKVFQKNKKHIFATETVCGICGKPVDFSLKYPDPMSACIDHIIPISKGGHPVDRENLQLAHRTCNRQKADKLLKSMISTTKTNEILGNRNLPQSMDWKNYRG